MKLNFYEVEDDSYVNKNVKTKSSIDFLVEFNTKKPNLCRLLCTNHV